MTIRSFLTPISMALALCVSAQADDERAALAAPVGSIVLKTHAVGAQIYVCRPDATGTLRWAFREPVAALISNGKTLGRHFAGPSWELPDGSLIVGQVTGKAAGEAAADVPWLKLDVVENKGIGLLKDVTLVQRVATVGGVKAGSCPSDGELAAEPYAADYVFSRP